MKKIFVDASALIAIANRSDQRHQQALALFGTAYEDGVKLFTTDYVLDEFLTYMRCTQKVPVKTIAEFLGGILASEIEMFGITRELFNAAFDLMVKYGDHCFSFTDCVSFEVMKELKITDALSSDQHFTIAGFNKLI